jgi:hypothetical protein
MLSWAGISHHIVKQKLVQLSDGHVGALLLIGILLELQFTKSDVFLFWLNGLSNIHVNCNILLLVNYLMQDKFDDNTGYN